METKRQLINVKQPTEMILKMILRPLRYYCVISLFITLDSFWFCESFRTARLSDSRIIGSWKSTHDQIQKRRASYTEPVNSIFSSSEDINEKTFRIRKCKYGDLKAVSEIIFASFYNEQMRKSPFSSFLELKELDRLQSNFPYNSEKHNMFVAIETSTEDKKIIGFVDIDARPATRRIDPPRPYMSDLAVHPDYRRQGIALNLIETCETIAREKLSANEMYIRVERENYVAVQMYEKIDYKPQQHEIFGVEDTTVLLHKTLD